MRVLIVDDHTLVAEAIARSLTAGHHETVGIARTGDEAVALLTIRQVDLILLDLSLPGKAGLEVLKEIHQRWSKILIVVLSMWDDQYWRDSAQQAGARGYLTKDVQEQTFFSALAAVARGEEWFPALRADRDGQWSRLDARIHVTPRQYQVLSLVAHGLGYKGMASRLGISIAAVDGHVRRLHRLFKVGTNTELVRKVMEHGILEAGAQFPPAGSNPPPV